MMIDNGNHLLLSGNHAALAYLRSIGSERRRVVAVPPALTIFAIVGFGVLFGPSGVVLATPLAVVAVVLIRRLYLHELNDGFGGGSRGQR